ncbi:zinc ion-binding protein [Prunus dulcis]|uniref:Zinc ion-binding protein n=1 Tax=Prunus dulcis TaxID=3755 RepID=A0A4Y1QXQ2_PRUDU|nr:zinc ion-binding protein [Prunus dulcis]
MLKSLARPWFRISAILYPEVLDPEQVVKGLSDALGNVKESIVLSNTNTMRIIRAVVFYTT